MSQDLRVTKTTMALKAAFLELSKQKKFDKITINELCETAMIRRSTFYRHYEDKYDFFSTLLRQMLTDFNEQNMDKYNELKPEEFYVAVIKGVLEFLKDHQFLAKSVIHSDFYQMLANILYDQIYSIIYAQLLREKENGYVFYVEEQRLAEFFTGGILRVVYNWMQEGQKTSIDELTEVLNKMLRHFWADIPFKQQ